MAETKPKATKTASSRLSFPQKVYNVLNLCEENHQEHIVSWMNDGTALKVHDLEQFEREMLPKYFNTQKYASFTRALCAHGFDCVRTGRQTGIYSHPKFNRNDPAAPSMIKRVKRTSNVKALNKLSNGSHGLILRDGNRSIMFPSLLDNTESLRTKHDNASVLGQLYQTVRSQIANRTTNALIRLPPGAHFISSDESGDDNSAGEQSAYNPIPASTSAVPSSSYRIAPDYNIMTLDQQDEHDHTHNSGSILDNEFAPIPLSPKDPRAPEEDDFEPIPWSPHTSLQNSGALYRSEDEAFLCSIEPRTIQEMEDKADDLNAFYDVLPMFPKPRWQALYDYSSPVALPGVFYFMNISSFGMCWAIFLIVGHTIQSLFTAYGPNTGDLVVDPKISLGKHMFMDILWVQSLLSAMILIPEYFGSSSVMLATSFMLSNSPSLGMSLKSHYHHFHSQKGRPFVYGEWWLSDIIKCLFLGYMVSAFCICLGHYSDMANLKVTGVFFMNLTPLFACESYRLLLSIPARLVGPNDDKKFK
ncbi:unnamed protein product [Cylindrotheca closterium]|uniref:HSF-type DNA-binding domain-containing protein n=1 Tax=Cylindrotheca closterium TaxID=2856 RepID=A0AAD2G212_9STRA|nr:unnamed protein product [Cylindrotheca closterium]